MANNNNNLMGLQLQMDSQYVENITKDIIKQTIINTFDDKREDFINQLVASVLKQPVDIETGQFKNSTYSSTTLINFMINKLVREQTQEILNEVLNEQKGKLRETLKKELSKQKTINAFLEAFTTGVLENLSNSWNTKIQVEIKNEKEY